MNKKTARTYKNLRPSSVIGGMGKREQDRKESEAIVEWPYRLSLWQGQYWPRGTHTHTHTHTHTLTHTFTHTQKESPNSPAGPVGEHDVAFLVCLLNESYACLFLPVTHGLLKHGPLTAWNTHISHPAFTQSHIAVCLTVEQCGQQSSWVAYQWSFLLWRREWLLRAISSQLGMWQLGVYGFSPLSQSSHLSQIGSWDWWLPCWSYWGDILTEQEEREIQLLGVMCVQTV